MRPPEVNSAVRAAAETVKVQHAGCGFIRRSTIHVTQRDPGTPKFINEGSVSVRRDMESTSPIPASYRDPAGFVINDGGIYKRVVTSRGRADYERLMGSGLHEDLASGGLLVNHYEEAAAASMQRGCRVLVPEQISFISYPYEWSFDELRDAALLTLEIQQRALARGLILKDASAYNVQFRGAKPVFVDTLSFTQYQGGPWAAYEQFCRHFLGPLLLMSYRSPDAARFLMAELEGFTLERVSRLLPLRSYMRVGPLLHIHLHARAVRRQPSVSGAEREGGAGHLSQLIASLRSAVERIRAPRYRAGWTDYYADGRFYPLVARETKREAVCELARMVRPKLVFDLGTNTGLYAKEVAAAGAACVAFDSDPDCVNSLYLEERGNPKTRILPLVMDLGSPSPSLGFELRSTLSIFERPQADLVMCLALMHHLRITGNLPLKRIAEFLAKLGRWLLIEFVPRTDPAVRTLTKRQEDFEDYNLPDFLETFTGRFRLRASRPLPASERVLYLFERLPCAT